MHLNDLPHLSRQARGALAKLDRWSEQDVAKLSRKYLRSRPGVGRKVIDQIERMLDEFGMHFIDSAPKVVRLAELRERERSLQRDLTEVRQEIAAVESNEI